MSVRGGNFSVDNAGDRSPQDTQADDGDLLNILNALTAMGCSPRRSPAGYSATCPIEGGTRRWVSIDEGDGVISARCEHCGLDVLQHLSLGREERSESKEPRFGMHRSGPIVDGELMAWTTCTTNEELCGTLRRRTLYRSTRTFSSVVVPCDNWDEEDCGTRKADRALGDLRTTGEAPRYWVDLPSQSDRDRKRLNAALCRARGGAVRIERKDGSVRYLVTGVQGLPASGTWLSHQEAVQAAIVGLRLPGMGRVDWSGTWRAARRAASQAAATERPVLSLLVRDARYDPVFDGVASQAEARWGVRPTRNYIPEEVDIDEFAAMLREALDPGEPLATEAPSEAVTDRPYEDKQGENGDTAESQGTSVTPCEGTSVTPAVLDLRAVSDPMLEAIHAEWSQSAHGERDACTRPQS